VELLINKYDSLLYVKLLNKLRLYFNTILTKLDVRVSFGSFLQLVELPVFTGDPVLELSDRNFFLGVDVPMDTNEPTAKGHFVALAFKDIAYTQTNHT